MSFSKIVNFHPASQRFHFDDFPCGSLSVFLNPQVSNTAGGYIHSRPCQENLPKSLKHNTLNKSRHRKETAQSLFMAELQLLSSKQQILLNLYQVSDEQQREKERAKQFFFVMCKEAQTSALWACGCLKVCTEEWQSGIKYFPQSAG